MELLDIVDKKGNPIGEVADRSVVHALGLPHRTAHIWIIREVNEGIEVLLQKRSQQKECYPGCYDTSSAGHISSGDEPIVSALRELNEELSIKLKEEDLRYIGNFKIQYQRIFHEKLFKDNEIAFVYLFNNNVNIDNLVLQKEEVESVGWHKLEELKKAVLSKDEQFCVVLDSIELIERYLKDRYKNEK